MNKNISKTKLFIAFISLIITFFVWQQGLRDSLSRPSVSFDISQKEKEIAELALPAIPINLRNLLIINDPIEDINNSLSEISFDQLTERNQLIWLISYTNNEINIKKEYPNNFDNKNYKLVVENLSKSNLDNSYKPNDNLLELFKDDRFLYHLLSKRFSFDESQLITDTLSKKMFLKIIAIRLLPLLTIVLGSLLVLRTLWSVLASRKIEWKEFKPLDLDLLDMVLLISGGFVVLGEVISPLFSITLVELVASNLSIELTQSLKIFFGYLFMAIPPLGIIYYQIKSFEKKIILKKDYFQFNFLPIKDSFFQGFKGFLMIIPFVLLVSLIMNLLVDNQNGSNPLLEIVLNSNNYLSFLLLFLTTTFLAPIFEEVIFRGVLLPILSREFGIILGITISAFIFALAHLSIGEMIPLFTLGIGLGTTRLISGRLSSSVIMHSLWNGMTFLNLFLLRT
ncbi:CPBP family intramembrane glutamic endopeptidase [uncultured Prochlorococcus sp.]|jgi:membrane protease YdiL (CAAX protease family)|uniref:CPBP family intramembrane glutamic endopeptidase n=1 Tax=Prochlorococcus sp. TaxID=1220 RepID=UPI000E028628|nr:type II CAAX endopeptidase family protein [uncultured Prochlorococcus sp.]RCL50426.1 MAG: CPBP family intramembrane metalloprotease [Prochlorococcus sp. MED-G72]|tara:strand:+ start:468 stop:1826 length:1359 start_codon:yes stop_codon:yes gene_type:complete